MREFYPYRFKTEKEFEFFYGEKWKAVTCWNKKGKMDYLFGKELEKGFNIKNLENILNYNKNTPLNKLDYWVIYTKMVLSQKEYRYCKIKLIKNNIKQKKWD